MTQERASQPRTTSAYESVQKASVVTVVFGIGATVLWFFVAPVVESWVKDWLVEPPVEIPDGKVWLMSFVRVWPVAWPAFVVFVWVVSFLPIELVRRIKARRSLAVTLR